MLNNLVLAEIENRWYFIKECSENKFPNFGDTILINISCNIGTKLIFFENKAAIINSYRS